MPALLQVLTRVTKLLELTKEDLEHFQTVTRTFENRPRAVYPSTALQAGLAPSLVQDMFFLCQRSQMLFSDPLACYVVPMCGSCSRKSSVFEM